MLDIKNETYIIVEIIPTASSPEKGEIIQLSALKLTGLQLLERFDYRLEKEKLPIPELQSWIDYDKQSFCYVSDSKKILKQFHKWAKDLPILILDEFYTPKYLDKLTNKLIPILPFLKETYSENIIDRLREKYHLEPSNYIVDLLYESLIQELS